MASRNKQQDFVQVLEAKEKTGINTDHVLSMSDKDTALCN